MSGIFRSNSTSNHSNDSTPNKRFSFSAFCTSPGTLQDVTMENPYGVGYRSPCVSLQPYPGSTSPAAQGRSVREFEEQMATLRKENFNLKLRLYFMEESIPGYKQNISSTEDTHMKQLIDTKVEMEILRKEVQEKQDLLKEAAHAMNQMEKIQKETESKYQQIVEDLNQKIQYLERERDMEKSHNAGQTELMNELLERSDVADNLNALQKIHELEGLLKQSDDNLTDFQQKIYNLEEDLVKRDEAIKEYEEKVKELVFQNAELLDTNEIKDKEITTNERFIRSLRSQNTDLKVDNEKLVVALKETQDNFSKKLSNLQTCERQMRNQQDVLSKMQAQQLRDELHKLKMDGADKSCMIQDLEEKIKHRDQLYDKARLTIQKLMISIKNQQEEISRLRNTTQASNVSHNEREHTTGGAGISGLGCTGLCRSFSDTEALNDLSSLQKQKYDNIIEQQEITIKNLKVEIKKKTADLQNLVNKELWEKNREIERLNKILNKSTCSPVSPATQNTDQMEINGELQQSFSDVEYNKALQRNKLLQRKVDILIQRLGTERQNDALIAQLKTELKQARLDAESAEKWRRQCTDLCATLSTRLEELAGFLNSLLKHKDVLGVLAVDKRKAMRRAVDRSLDLSKSLNMTLSVSGLSMLDQSLAELTSLSDILGDIDIDLENKTFNSHEDVNRQSIEVLKAENKALKKELDRRRNADSKKERRSLPLPMMAENRESESEAWSEPDRKVSLARIGLEDHSHSLMTKEQPLTVKSNETDSDYSDANNRSFKARSQERINQLEQQIQQRDNRILEIQCQLVDADNRLKKENLKVLEVNQELQQLRQRNEELHNDLVAIGSQEPSNESLLQKQIEEKSRCLDNLQEERERLLVESKLAEMQINSLKADMEVIKQSYEEALQQSTQQEQQKLNTLKQEMEQAWQQILLAKEKEYEENLQKDYVATKLYEEVAQHLNDLQKQYIEAQRTIESLQENEQELKQTLVETELASRHLQKQIDDSTLRASKAAMERVKALNDKLKLEKKVEELTLELNKQEHERRRMEQQIEESQQVQQSLQERLAAGMPTKQHLIKNDEGCPSGYTSEEVPIPHSSSSSLGHHDVPNIVAQQRLGEQRVQNSSPDLGIESDAGRVSSVELNSVQRPLLKTVEMSLAAKHSSNESDDKEGLHDSSAENIKPDIDANSASVQQLAKKHDCLKVEQENAELRRKLLRTKRAFEDTYEKLRNANQRKAQIEKDIKNQILKTHNVLKNVRSNMENEL